MELYPRDTDDMRVVLETGHARRKTSATGVPGHQRGVGLEGAGAPSLPPKQGFPRLFFG